MVVHEEGRLDLQHQWVPLGHGDEAVHGDEFGVTAKGDQEEAGAGGQGY